MQKWEYRTVTASVVWDRNRAIQNAGLSDTELAQLGNDGWELVGVSPLIPPDYVSFGRDDSFASSNGTTDIHYIFKRPKP